MKIYLAGLRGETVFRDTLQICLDADDLTLPTIYNYLNDLCRLIHCLNACFIDGHMRVQEPSLQTRFMSRVHISSIRKVLDQW